MIFYILFVVAVIVILLILLALYIVCKRYSKLFSNGTWIDSDGNILVMKLDKKIKISFGISVNDSYELAENEYDYSISNGWSSYTINVKNGMKINVDTVKGIATVYDKKKKIGKFAKNNLLAFD